MQAQIVQPILQRAAIQVFHHHERLAFEDIEVVKADDIGMAKPGNQPGLQAKAIRKTGVFGKMRVDDLDRHPPIEQRITRFVDRSHAAASQRADHRVFAE
jgi:hypothetical protein